MAYVLLNEIYPTGILNSGIITDISSLEQNIYPLPWDSEIGITNYPLDTMYYTNHGNKITSPMLDYITNDIEVTELNRIVIAKCVYSMYAKKWKKLYDIMVVDYNPLNNATMTETTVRNVNDTGSVQNNDSLSHGEIVDTTGNSNGSNAGDVYGFNDSSAAHADKTTLTNTATGKETHSGSDINESTRTDNLHHDESIDYHRAGSIGIITPQTMISQERNLWNYSYFQNVFSDLDDILTLSIY